MMKSALFRRFENRVLFAVILILQPVVNELNGQRPSVQKNLEVFNITDGFFNEKKMFLSEICSGIDYVKLESQPDSYIQYVDIIQVGNKFICIADTRNYKAFLFAHDGRFIKSLGRTGKGPGEYVDINSLSLSGDEQWVALFDAARRKVILYATGSDVTKEITVTGGAVEVVFGPDDLLLASYTYSLSVTNSNFQFAWINITDGSKIAFGLVPERIRTWGSIVIPVRVCDHELVVNQLYNDTIYSIKNTGALEPRIYFEIRRNRLPVESYRRPERLLEYTSDKASYSKFFYSDHRIILNASYFNKARQIIYNRQSHDCTYLPYNSDFHQGVFENDIDGGPPVWPDAQSFSGCLVNLIYPHKLLEYQKSGLLKRFPPKNQKAAKAFDRFLAEMNENDNPVIQILR